MQDTEESSELEDFSDGDDSVSLSDSVSEETQESDDRVPPVPDNMLATSIATPTASARAESWIPSPTDGDQLMKRIPGEAAVAKPVQKFQPIVTIIRQPRKIQSSKTTSNEQLATPLGSEPPEESTTGAKRSLRVTTLERWAHQMTQAVAQKLEKTKEGQSSVRKSPRKR